MSSIYDAVSAMMKRQLSVRRVFVIVSLASASVCWGSSTEADVILDSGLIETDGLPQIGGGTFYGYQTPDVGPGDEAFEAAKSLAEEKHVPLIVIWSNKGCSLCNNFNTSLNANKDSLSAWMASKNAVFAFFKGEKTQTANRPVASKEAYQFINTTCKASGTYPRIGLYCKKADGSVVTGALTSENKTYSYFRDGVTDWATANGINLEMTTWPQFVVRNSPGDRLETLANATETEVAVPLSREDCTGSYTNWIAAVFPDNVRTAKVEWVAGQATAYPVITVPADLTAGTEIALKLYDGNLIEQETSVLYVVDDPGNSVENPYWMGEKTVETLAFGEWTMDFALATNKTAQTVGDAHTLVLITGALWCPWCGGLENGVLNTEAFKTWAKDNKLSLAILDNAKRPAGDKGVTSSYTEETADTNIAYTISTVQTGEGPTLLRYDRGKSYWKTGDDLFSGASYLSRKGIATDEDRALAEAVLKRNLDLGYAEGLLCEPGTMRSNFGCLILLDKAGNVVGRWVREAPNQQFDTAENMQRLDDMLKTASAHPVEDGYAATSSLTHALGESAAAALSVNARQKVYRLTGLPSKGRVTFAVTENATSRPVTLKLLVKRALDVTRVDAETSPVGKATCEVGIPVAASETALAPTLEVDVETADDYYLKVSAFADAESVCYGTTDTDISVSFASSLVLTPEETKQTLAVAAEAYSFEIDPARGRDYKFEGLKDSDLAVSFDGPVNGVYTLKDAIDEKMTLRLGVAADADEISYRLWRPGTVTFRDASLQVFKLVGSNEVVICRENGACDGVSFRVKVGAGSAPNGLRYEWDEDRVYSWADGESAPISVWLTMNPDLPYTTNEVVYLELVSAGPSATALSEDPLTVTLCDTEKPTLSRLNYDMTLYSGFAATTDELLDVYNIQGNGVITLRKISGSLPSGVRLTYDKNTRALVLSGSPTKVTASTATYTLSEKRGRTTVTGPAVTFSFTVADPADANSWLSRALTMSLPVFRMAETNEMVGLVTFSATAKNKLSAKYVCTADRTTTSFSGLWSRLSEDGTATTTLTAKKASLDIALSADGTCRIELDDTRYPGEELASGTFQALDGSAFASCSGKYTVALPQAKVENPTGVGGAGYLTINFTSASNVKKGLVPYAGVLPNGTSFSGSVTLTGIDDNFASVPVFVHAAKYKVSVPMKLRWAAAAASLAMSSRALVAQDGKAAAWTDANQCGLFAVYGSYFDESVALTNHFGGCGASLVFSEDLSSIGLAEICGQDADVLLGEKTASLLFPISGVRISYAAKTGVVSGSTRAVYLTGRTYTAKFRGVVIPGWTDCGSCGGDPDTVIPALEHDQPQPVVGQMTVGSTVGVEMALASANDVGRMIRAETSGGTGTPEWSVNGTPISSEAVCKFETASTESVQLTVGSDQMAYACGIGQMKLTRNVACNCPLLVTANAPIRTISVSGISGLSYRNGVLSGKPRTSGVAVLKVIAKLRNGLTMTIQTPVTVE